MHEGKHDFPKIASHTCLAARKEFLHHAGMAQDVAALLKLAREKAGKTQDQLAEAVGVSRSAVGQWETGRTFPSTDNLIRALSFLGVPISPEREAPPDVVVAPPEQPLLGARDLPVYAAAEGGPGEMVVSTDPIEFVPRPWYLGAIRDGFAVLVVGDSMEPVFEAGDMAVVNPRLAPMRGKDVILVADDGNGTFAAMLKRMVSWTETEWRVRQFNPPQDFVVPRDRWPKALRVVGKYYG